MSAERGIPRKRGAAHNCGLASRSSCFPSPCSSRSRRGSRAHTHACRGRADACEHAQAGLSVAAEAVRGRRLRGPGRPQADEQHRIHRPNSRQGHGPAGRGAGARGAGGRGRAPCWEQPCAPPPSLQALGERGTAEATTGAAPSAREANAPSRVTRGRAGGRSCVVAPGADPAVLELLDNSQLSCHTSSDA